MGYQSTRECVDDLERHGQLVRIREELDPDLEMAEVQRRVYEAQGPAILFERVKGSPFPAVSNLFGTHERCRFLFRDTLDRVQSIIRLRADPTAFWRSPLSYWWAPFVGLRALPRKVGSGPVLAKQCRISDLPQIRAWPDDGGAFVMLPQVYTEDPDDRGPMKSNLGMYRIQMSGNEYTRDEEVGMHYQIHRGIGAHHSAAIRRGEKLPVSIFVGGPPAHTFAAVMPLPEGMTELTFAGLLSGQRVQYCRRHEHKIATHADFCIVGTVDPERTLPEGPFGDHLGYYSLAHQFPVLDVERVYHRADAIWPFTIVGRPPQEDTTFGKMIQELTAPMVPREIPGLHEMHAVDEAGVHPLLLAIGSERYVPYRSDAPQELLTIANAILGFSQASLAKYLFIVDRHDDPDLSTHDVPAFLAHVLRRVDWRRDLHFHTNTTIDTLDYSGSGLNAGSKVVIAARGAAKRSLCTELPSLSLPDGFKDPRIALPGVVVVEGPAFTSEGARADVDRLAGHLQREGVDESLPLVVLVDDAEFSARNTRNFLWVCFTRSNPSHDIQGVGASIEYKHWGCSGPLIVDARQKPHHAPPLIEDPGVSKRVEALASPGGPLHGVL
jgi:4-hydroxy-3-polyprenylbenzoate decarboxylase